MIVTLRFALAALTSLPLTGTSSHESADAVRDDARVKKITRAAARRIALAAQGFGAGRPAGKVTMRHLDRMIRHTGLIQIDSVNVLARAHLMPLYSRSGPYDPGLIERAYSREPRRLVEYWAHEASLIPPQTRHLFAWRMRRAHLDGWQSVRAASEQGELLEAVVAEIERRGPLTAGEVGASIDPDHVPDRSHWGWNWPPVKSALEYLFWSGRLASASRTTQFERRYDLPERVIPGEARALPPPDDAEAIERLIEISARAHGIGTAACLRDYFRIPAADARPAIESLAAEGRLIEVDCEAFAGPPTSIPKRSGRGAPRGARCSHPSTRSSSSAGGPRACSASVTGSRSTFRGRNANTATTCCRSCSTRHSSRGST